jgi:hypothetical protein
LKTLAARASADGGSAILDRVKPTTDATLDGCRSLPTPHDGGRVTLEEIREALADDGYSGGWRKAWVKEVLTEVVVETRTAEGARLIVEIKAVINQFQDGAPALLNDIL